MKKIITISCILMFSVSYVFALNLGKVLKSVAKGAADTVVNTDQIEKTANSVTNVIKKDNGNKNYEQTMEEINNSKGGIDEIWQDENYDKNMELADKNNNSISKINISGYILGEKFVNKGESIANVSNERFLKVHEPDYLQAIGDEFCDINKFNFYRDRRIAYGKNILLILNSENEIGGIILNTTKKEIKAYAKNIISKTKEKNIAKNIPMKCLGGFDIEYYSSINSYENFKIITVEAFKRKEIKGKETLTKVGEWMLFSKVDFYVPPKIDTIYNKKNFHSKELKEAQDDVNWRYRAFFNFMDKYKVGTKIEISDKETYREEQKIGNTKYDIFSIDNDKSRIWINQKTGVIERLTIFPNGESKYWEYDYKYLFYKYYKFNYYYSLEQANQSFEFINKDCLIGNNNSVLLIVSRLYYSDNTFDCFLDKNVCEKILKATMD